MISNNVYLIDFEKLVKIALPTFLRKPKWLAYLSALFEPLKSLYRKFYDFKTESIYKVSHNSQICYMQKVLNDRFDYDLRRIVIRNTIVREPNWLYDPADNRPKHFYNEVENPPRYLYNQSDFVGDGFDFIVIVPLAIKPELNTELIIYETEMKALINYYKLYSKNYTIRYE